MLPGVGLKRWLGVAFFGLFQLALGVGLLFNMVMRYFGGSQVVDTLTLRFIPRFPRSLLFLGSGALTTFVGWRRLSRALMRIVAPERPGTAFGQLVQERQRAALGRRVAVVGGEPGLSPVIEALQQLDQDVRIDVLLSATERGSVARELQSKFGLTTDQVIYPTEAESVLYAELDDGTLLEGATTINRKKGGTIRDLFLSRDIRRVQVWEAENDGKNTKAKLKGYMPNVSERALEALEAAEVIILAPGHIYTQVLPNLTQPRFAQAVRESQAVKVFIANLMTEPGRTDGWSVAEHLEAIREMTGIQLDYALVHQGQISEAMLAQYRNEGAAPVEFRPTNEVSRLIFADTGEQTTLMEDAIIIGENVVTEAPQIVAFQRNGDTILREMPVVRHDPDKMAKLFQRLITEAL